MKIPYESLIEVYLELKQKWPFLNLRHLKRAVQALDYLQKVKHPHAFNEAVTYAFAQGQEKENIQSHLNPKFQRPRETNLSFIPQNLEDLLSYLQGFVKQEVVNEKDLRTAFEILLNLLNHQNTIVRVWALKTIYSLMPNEFIREVCFEELKDYLNSSNWQLKEQASACLCNIALESVKQNQEKCINLLKELTNHPDWHVFQTAAKALAKAYAMLATGGSKDFLNQLFDLLKASQTELVLAGLQQISWLYPRLEKDQRPELTPILELLGENNLDICTMAIETLGEIYAIKPPSPSELRLLERKAHSPYSRVREKATFALGKVYLNLFKNKRKVDLNLLHLLLEDEDWRVRIAAINALYPLYITMIKAHQNPPLEKIEKRLGDRYSPVINAAAQALGKICAEKTLLGNNSCLKDLESRFNLKDWHLSRKISIALAQVYTFMAYQGDKTAQKKLEQMLENRDFYVSIVAIGSLTSIYKDIVLKGEKPPLEKLEPLLEHPKIYVRISVISSLAEIYATLALKKQMEYLKILEEWLEGNDPDIVKAAADNLIQVYGHFFLEGKQEYLPKILKMLSINEPAVVQDASRVLNSFVSKVFQMPENQRTLKKALSFFERHLNKRLESPLKGSHASAIKIKDDWIKIGLLFLERKEQFPIFPCVFTTSSFQMLKVIALATLLKHPVLLLGPTSTGKSFLIKWLAQALGYQHISYTINPYTSKFELIGGIKPDKQGHFRWQDGVCLQAAKEGKWLVLEEINLASSEVIEILNDYLTTGTFIYSQEGIQKKLIPHPNFRLFATANPESYAQRQRLSSVFLSRWQVYYQSPLPEQEIAEILSSLFEIPASFSLLAARFHKTLEDQAEAKIIGRDEKDGYIFSLRDIMQLGKRLREIFTSSSSEEKMLLDLFFAFYEVYLTRIRKETERKALLTLLDTYLGLKAKGIDMETSLSNQSLLSLTKRLKVAQGDAFVPSEASFICPTPAQRLILYHIVSALIHEEHILLVGPPASGKTTLVRYLASQKKANLFYLNLSSDSSLEELLGGYVQDEHGKWVYQPGLLFRAVKNGDWLLIDEANLNPLSEYLNTLLDFGYILDEKGCYYHAHPHFRLFLAINPPSVHRSRNLLSPALRTRFCEIWVEEPLEKGEIEEIMINWLKEINHEK